MLSGSDSAAADLRSSFNNSLSASGTHLAGSQGFAASTDIFSRSQSGFVSGTTSHQGEFIYRHIAHKRLTCQGTPIDTRRTRRNVNRGGRTTEAYLDSEIPDSAASSSTETT